MHYVYDLLRILVGLWSFFREKVLAVHADGYASCSQLVEQVFAAQRLPGGGAALAAAGPVAAGAEALLHRTLGSNQYEGVTAHVAGDKNRLADGAIRFRDGRVTGGDGRRRAFAVDTELLHLSIDLVFLHLGDVVADVIDHRHVSGACLAPEHARERLPYSVHQQLTVGPGKVRATGHGREIGLPFFRLQRETGQLAVYQVETKVVLL